MNQFIPPQGKWAIARHNGRKTSQWLLILISDNENNARHIYDQYQKILTSGAVRLYGPAGEVVLQHVAYGVKA